MAEGNGALTERELARTRESVALRFVEHVDEIVRIAETPAPPFGEERRARYVLGRMAEIGLDSPRLDAEGNAIAELAAPHANLDPQPTIVVAAHLDTVFPEDTDVTVTRENGRLRGPGVGDNAANLSAMLTAARILVAEGGISEGRLVFVGTVGEEGLGNLRGMRRLMADRGDRVDAVVCVDGLLGTVVTAGVGSLRLRITARGPGGHAFGDFGRPSAVEALARFVASLGALELPRRPRTTYNVGTFRGGDAINAIASHAEIFVDLRSESAAELARLTARFDALLADAHRAESPEIELGREVVGDRPAGTTPPRSPLVRTVRRALKQVGRRPRLTKSSTDANVPMSLGIPAVTFGTYVGQGAHTRDEEIRLAGMDAGIAALVLCLRDLTGGRSRGS